MKRSWIVLLMMLLAACGGGGGGGTAPTPTPPVSQTPDSSDDPAVPAISVAQAHRFLRQTTFGPTPESVAHVRDIGYEAWVDEQLEMPASLQIPYIRSLGETDDVVETQGRRIDAWFQNAVRGEDQLRQRVAFALSEIMVVSDRSVLFNTPLGLAYYYDLLARRSFGNYRELMQTVTLTPAMGVYLSMLGNQKPDPERNIRPDENYARELMQLFTLGLVELDLDGTVRLDGNGEPIPTYDQSVIEGFAHVFTGWTFAFSEFFHRPSYNYLALMQPWDEFHDTGEKKLLNGLVLPAGQTPDEDLSQALDNIFEHGNVAPFVSRQLIQRLVTANPSPDYVRRVAGVFADNGNGVRGDLGAVVRAIVLDPDARDEPVSDASGKLTEPLLRLVSVWRAYDAAAQNGRFGFFYPEYFFSQAPLRSPSVFNFFSPDFSPTGEISDRGLVSPEMQITHEATAAGVNDYLGFVIFLRNSGWQDLGRDAIIIDIDAEIAMADDVDVLVEEVAQKLLGGRISPSLRSMAVEMASLHDNPGARAAEAIYTVATSPEYAVLP